ncbi:hypothetical protein CACET_c21160 [Clostridium aceticum]|uniref:Uncharacterized protein n=1 Tax=Clostridium aceticum TaxID=84022 RepID=A0A0D8IA11_9CLOT|nr:hypothetical protein [Clostridium aceticum]AKL95563.1 hypothetical protein CACET_c21160 [Clostridium aceticum]KJF26857.1 hypothetical protein TZ02_11685 [Clostridium aceticum]
MVDFLGWLNIFLILFAIALYPVKKASMIFLRKNIIKSIKWIKYYRIMSTLHPYVGGLIVLVGCLHSYLAMGGFKLHSGSFILGTVILMGMIAILGRKIKGFNKSWRLTHKILGVFVFAFIINHLL